MILAGEEAGGVMGDVRHRVVCLQPMIALAQLRVLDTAEPEPWKKHVLMQQAAKHAFS
jgi:hypothetical protein